MYNTCLSNRHRVNKNNVLNMSFHLFLSHIFNYALSVNTGEKLLEFLKFCQQDSF